MPAVSDDELFGGAATPAPVAQLPAGQEALSDDELFGGGAEPVAKPARQYKSKTNAGMFFEDVVENLKNPALVAKGAAGALTTAGDFVIDNFVGGPFRLAAEAQARSAFKKQGHDEKIANILARDYADEVGGYISSPLTRLSQYAARKFGSDYDPAESGPAQALQYAGEKLEEGYTKIQQSTRGGLERENVRLFTDATLNAAGVGGLVKGHRLMKDSAARKAAGKGGPTGPEVPPVVEPEPPAPTSATGKPRAAADPERFRSQQELAKSDAYLNAEQQAYDLMSRGASKAQVEAIIRKNPRVGEAMDAILARRGMVKESRLGEVLQGEVVDGMPRPDFGNPEVISLPKPGDTFASAVKEHPQLLLSTGLATTALGLALTFPDSSEESLMAASIGGALIIGRNRGLSMSELAQFDAKTPLGVVLNNSPYTLKTLERLDRGKFLFNRKELEQAVKRQDVSEVERTLITKALSGIEGDKISAKDLVYQVRANSEGHMFNREEIEDYKEYGLENIGRKDKDAESLENFEPETQPGQLTWEPEGGWPETSKQEEPTSVAPTTNLYRNNDRRVRSDHFGSNVFGHTRSFVENGVRHVVEVQSDFAQKELKPVSKKELEDVRIFSGKMEELAASVEKNQKQLKIIDNSSGYYNAPDWSAKTRGMLDDLEKINEDVRMVIGHELVSRNGLSEWPELYKNVKDLDPDDALTAVVKQAEGFVELRKVVNSAVMKYGMRVSHLLQNQQSLVKRSRLIRDYSGLAKTWQKRLVREELSRAAEVKDNPEFIAKREEAKQALRDAREGEEYIKNSKEFANKDVLTEYQAYIKRKYSEAKSLVAEAAAIPRTLPPETSVRFATADTVAKVEGWPEKVPNRLDEQALANTDPETIARLRELYASQEGSTGRFADLGHQSLYENHTKNVDAFTKSLGGQLITDSKGHTWIEVPLDKFHGPPQMYGKADPEFVKFLAGLSTSAAVGAYLSSPENTYLGAGLGMALGAMFHSQQSRKATADVARRFLGTPSTDLLNASPPLLRRSYNLVRLSKVRTHQWIQRTESLKTELGKLDRVTAELVERAFLDNDPAKVKAALAQANSPSLTAAWTDTRKLMDEVGKELLDLGIITSRRDAYFPRVMKDYAGFREFIGEELGSKMDEVLRAAESRSFSRRGVGLTDAERSIVINNFLQGREAMSGKRSFAKERRLEEVTPDTQKFYEKAIPGLHTYLNSAANSIERSRFFGKNATKTQVQGVAILDVDKSIGTLLNEEIRNGNLKAKDRDMVEQVFRSVLQMGEKTPDAWVQDLRSGINSALLANPVSAVNQLNEIGPIMYMHGVRPGLQALIRQLTGRGTVDMRTLGLEDHISQEFVGERIAAKATKKLFKAAGFTAVDTLMKSTALEASKIKWQNRLKTAKGEALFRDKFEEFFGKDTAAVIADLRSEKTTNLTEEVRWYELSETQPTSNFEIPRALLDNPNGRILASMKTFMLKQADVVRRGAYKDIKEGRVLKGSADLMRMALLYGTVGVPITAVTSWMMNRDYNFELSDIPTNFAKTFMWSNYMADQAEKKGPGQLVWENVIAPPFKVVDSVIAPLWKNPTTEKEQEKIEREFMKVVPLFGKLYEANVMGGGEKFQENKAKADKAALSRERRERAVEEKGSVLSEEDLKELRKQLKMEGK